MDSDDARTNFRSKAPSRIVLAVTALGAACAGGDGADRPEADLALRDVAVVDVASGTVTPEQTVWVRDDSIVAVSATTDGGGADDIEVVEGRGRYLIPGLWDMHTHLTYVTETLPLYLAHGVTGVRDMGGAADSTLAVRDSIRSGALEGPWVFAAGPIVDGPKPGIPWRLTVRTREEGESAVDSLMEIGADFVKVHNGISREAFEGVISRANELGVTVTGHAPPSLGLRASVDAGMNSIEHTTAILEAALERDAFSAIDLLESSTREFLAAAEEGIVARMAADSVYATPTPVAGVAAGRRIDPDGVPAPQEQWVPQGVRNFWAFMPAPENPPEGLVEARRRVGELGLEIVASLHRAGVPLMAGTDVGLPTVVPGHSLHEELELLVESGLTPGEALRTATLNPARYLGATDSVGLIEPGMRADLVLLEGNPLDRIENVGKIAAVVVRGRLLDSAALDRMLPPLRTDQDTEEERPASTGG